MKTSTDRIMTTHAGSLPRPPELLKLVRAKLAGQPYDEKELAAEVTRSVEALTKRAVRKPLERIAREQFVSGILCLGGLAQPQPGDRLQARHL